MVVSLWVCKPISLRVGGLLPALVADRDCFGGHGYAFQVELRQRSSAARSSFQLVRAASMAAL